MVDPEAAIERRVKKILPLTTFDYIAGGAGDERTLQENKAAFKRIRFIPRFLRNVSNVSTATTLPHIGQLSFPALVAPMAMQCMFHTEGELGIASAAHHVNVPYILSTLSTKSVEKVAKVHPDTLLLQLYVYRDRKISEHLLARAKRAGCRAVVFTVDAPKFGRRDREEQGNFQLPHHLSFENFTDDQNKNIYSLMQNRQKIKNSSLLQHVNMLVEDNFNFDDITWIKNISGLPVWVKGILHPNDAVSAVNAGASAIVVSNHGGRQLEGCIPAIEALPNIRKAVKNSANILVDSGIRSGEDILRALAMGADAVLIGRPVLWALAEGGEQNVKKLLMKFQRDFELTMALCGVTTVKDVTKDLVSVECTAKM